MNCNQVTAHTCNDQGDITGDNECGKEASHFLFGDSECPICDECIEAYRASMINGKPEWTEEELALVPIPKGV